MAIVLLKPALMDNAYEFLFNEYLKQKRFKRFIVQLTKFMFYVQKQWMKSKIRKMISFYDVHFKTNNWSESNDIKRSWSLFVVFTSFSGYNSALQRRAQRSHLSVWTLIELLITEETAVRIKHFQVLNGKRKTVNKTIRDDVVEINKNIITFNEQFENGEIQLDECLLRLASLIGVKYDKWRKQRKKNKRREEDVVANNW